MLYHFTQDESDELKPVECGFGEHCPAASHYADERQALAELKAVEALANSLYQSPVPALDGEAFALALKMVAGAHREDEGLYELQELREGYTDGAIENILIDLLRRGYINGPLVSTTDFIEGSPQPSRTELLWIGRAQSWGRPYDRPSKTINLSAIGGGELDKIEALDAVRLGAEDKLAGFRDDGEELEQLAHDIRILLEQPKAAVLPRISKLFRSRVDQLLKADEAAGSEGSYWDKTTVAESLACSPSAAQSVIRQLEARGLIGYVYRTHYRGEYYKINRAAIALVGGLEKAVGLKPE